MIELHGWVTIRETYKVTVDGEEITSRPAEKLPLTQLYSLF